VNSSDGFFGFDIGKMLGLPNSALEEIKSSYQSWAKQNEACLNTYAHHHPCPSWKRINEVLRNCSLYQQAEEVKSTYVEGMHTSSISPSIYLKQGGPPGFDSG
jgi:hypothetical protein